MDITLGIICLFLEKQYHITKNNLTGEDPSVKNFQMWNGEEPEEDLLYIIKNEQLAEFLQKEGQLCIRIQYSECGALQGCHQIIVRESIEQYELINALQNIFYRFYGWQLNIQRLFYTHADFGEILNTIECTYDLVVALVDKNLQYMAFSKSYCFYNTWVGNEKTMPLETVHDMMDDEKFRTAIQHDHAFLYYNIGQRTYVYCYNIKNKGEYEGRLLIQSKTGGRFPGGLALGEYVGKSMAETFTYNSQEQVLYDFYDIIKELLQGLSKSPEEINQKLEVRKWKREHQYQVYRFQFMEESASVTRRYYQSKIENIFHDCCVLSDGQGICCIWNLSATSEKNRDVRPELSVFLRDNLCQAGISQRFCDISFLRSFDLEAQYALALGLRSGDTSWYYPFETMILPFIWNQAVRELPREQLYHPGILILKEYDEREHTELTTTAKEYMKRRYNVTETAKALFVHRTTLIFRLQRIEKLTGIRWERWEERLWIGITFELMEYI